ncbi:MAG: hypothetical protein Q9201_005987 [Fulgogasparrea decipioides]
MTETPRASTDSSNREHIWVLQEDYERPQKEMDFPSASLTNKMPRHELRINPYSKSDLHERYMSSEEEPSPSPDSSDAESTHSEELKHKSSARVLATEEAPIDLAALDSDAKTEIAVAMPIVAYGRPKLIDIKTLAPMQKRKRVIKQPIAPSTVNKQTLARKISNLTNEHKPFAANEAAEVVVPAEIDAIIVQKQAAMAANKRLKEEKLQTPRLTPVSSAPDSWLPEEDEEQYATADEEREYHFPTDPDTYDPYTRTEPPRPSPSRLSNRSHTATTGRQRNNSNPFSNINTTSLGKGLTRTWSIAKKGVVHHGSFSSATSASSQQQQQREQAPLFSSNEYKPERQVTKKPKMIARGANEREESLILPPCPFEAVA